MHDGQALRREWTGKALSQNDGGYKRTVMVRTYTFDNGLRLIVKEMDGLMSVTMGILVGAGGAYETDREDGISHYIEHMHFKGTATRTARQISDAFDNIGAQVNAFTGKDITCYYSKATQTHAEEAFALLSDIFLNSTFPDEEAVREKEVIVQEICMNEDSPDDLCMDDLGKAIYGKEGYGRNILGPAENVRGFTKEDVAAYKSQFYRPENIVISFAGAVSFDKAKELTERYFAGMEGGKFTPREKPVNLVSQSLCRNKKIEQVHIAIGYPGVCRTDPRLEALQIGNTILGNGMSSRLFQEVREKLGLAYTVYSFITVFRECGHLTIYAGVSPDNVTKAYEAIIREIKKVLESGITDAEFRRAREQLRASGIFSQESTSSQMLWYGRNLLYDGVVDSFEEQQARYDAVTAEDVMTVMRSTYGEKPSGIGVVGDVSEPLSF